MGEGIPIEARIISVADVFDSLTSDRPYRQAVTPFDAKEIIVRGLGTEFDPRVVDAFLSAFRNGGMEVSEVVVYRRGLTPGPRRSRPPTLSPVARHRRLNPRRSRLRFRRPQLGGRAEERVPRHEIAGPQRIERAPAQGRRIAPPRVGQQARVPAERRIPTTTRPARGSAPSAATASRARAAGGLIGTGRIITSAATTAAAAAPRHVHAPPAPPGGEPQEAARAPRARSSAR